MKDSEEAAATFQEVQEALSDAEAQLDESQSSAAAARELEQQLHTLRSQLEDAVCPSFPSPLTRASAAPRRVLLVATLLSSSRFRRAAAGGSPHHGHYRGSRRGVAAAEQVAQGVASERAKREAEARLQQLQESAVGGAETAAAELTTSRSAT